MVPTPCLVLRGALAVAVAVLASSLSGTIAVAQQIAVNGLSSQLRRTGESARRPSSTAYRFSLTN